MNRAKRVARILEVSRSVVTVLLAALECRIFIYEKKVTFGFPDNLHRSIVFG